MPTNNNSASRLHKLFSENRGHSAETSTLTAWATAFEHEEADQDQLAIEVSQSLSAVRRELKIVHSSMSNAAYSPSLYEKAISAFEKATSPMLLHHPWRIPNQYLTSENLLALQYCSEILPDEELLISESEFDELQTLVANLSKAAQEEGIPESLRILLLHHVELIKKGIANYQVSGVKALRETLHTGIGEIVTSKGVLDGHGSSQQISALIKLWNRLGQVTDKVIKTDRLLEIGIKIEKFIDTVKDL